MYDGEAFKHLEATSLDDEDLEVAQGSLQIISGLYGLLGPLDLIKPYRWRAFNFLILHHDTNVDTHACGRCFRNFWNMLWTPFAFDEWAAIGSRKLFVSDGNKDSFQDFVYVVCCAQEMRKHL